MAAVSTVPIRQASKPMKSKPFGSASFTLLSAVSRSRRERLSRSLSSSKQTPLILPLPWSHSTRPTCAEGYAATPHLRKSASVCALPILAVGCLSTIVLTPPTTS